MPLAGTARRATPTPTLVVSVQGPIETGGILHITAKEFAGPHLASPHALGAVAISVPLLAGIGYVPAGSELLRVERLSAI
jgi:hypothetical protein